MCSFKAFVSLLLPDTRKLNCNRPNLSFYYHLPERVAEKVKLSAFETFRSVLDLTVHDFCFLCVEIQLALRHSDPYLVRNMFRLCFRFAMYHGITSVSFKWTVRIVSWMFGFDITLRYRHLIIGSLSFIFVERTCLFITDFSRSAHHHVS